MFGDSPDESAEIVDRWICASAACPGPAVSIRLSFLLVTRLVARFGAGKCSCQELVDNLKNGPEDFFVAKVGVIQLIQELYCHLISIEVCM